MIYFYGFIISGHSHVISKKARLFHKQKYLFLKITRVLG